MHDFLFMALLLTVSPRGAARAAEYCAMVEAVLDDEPAFLDEDCCTEKTRDGLVLVEVWLSSSASKTGRRRPLLEPGTVCNAKYRIVDGPQWANHENKAVSTVVVEFQRQRMDRYAYDASEVDYTPGRGVGSSGCGAVASGTITKVGKRWVRRCEGCPPR
jgi:hypothetical protein